MKIKISTMEKSELIILRFASLSARKPNQELETDIIENIKADKIPAFNTSVKGESVLLLKSGLI